MKNRNKIQCLKHIFLLTNDLLIDVNFLDFVFDMFRSQARAMNSSLAESLSQMKMLAGRLLASSMVLHLSLTAKLVHHEQEESLSQDDLSGWEHGSAAAPMLSQTKMLGGRSLASSTVLHLFLTAKLVHHEQALLAWQGASARGSQSLVASSWIFGLECFSSSLIPSSRISFVL